MTPAAARLIAALRACAANGGQGHSYDREAVREAQESDLLEWIPAFSGYWEITPAGLAFIEANAPEEERGA
jgi:hypothetical protein